MHGVQGTLDDLGTALSAVTFVVVDLETTGGSPPRRASPRSAPSRCAAARCSASSRPWSTRPSRSRAFISVLTGITDRDGRRRPAHRQRPARVPRVRPRRRPRRAQRAASTSASSRPRPPATGHDWPRFPVLDTAHLARQLVTRDEAPNHKLSTLAQLFGATTTPDHRALHDARATVDVLHGLIERVGNLGVAHPRGALELHLPGHAAPSAASATSPTALPAAPGVYLFKDGSGRVLYVGTSRDIRTPRPHLLHRLRAAHPDGRDGAARRERHARRLPHHPRGRGPRAAAHRRAQAALQPPLAPPRAGPVGQAHRRGRSPGCRSCARSATTAPATSGRSAPGWPPSRPSRRVHEVVPLRQCTKRLSARGRGPPPARWPTWAAAARPARGRRASRTTPPSSPRRRRAHRRRPRGRLGACTSGWALLAEPGALRGRRRRARPVAAPRPGCRPRPAARAARRAAPRSSPPAVAPRRLGARLRPLRPARRHARQPPRRRPDALRRGPHAPAPRSSRPAPAPPPAGTPEETEKVLRWLEAPGRAHRRSSTASGPARSAAPAPRGPSSSPWPPPHGRRRLRRTRPGDPVRPPLTAPVLRGAAPYLWP